MDYSKLSKKELIMLLREREVKVRVNDPNNVFEALKKYWDKNQEVFVVIGLNAAKEIIYEGIVTKGLINKVLVHPREVYAPVIEHRCSSLIVAHNHPSRNLQPSSDDENVTRSLRNAGNILGIELLDHIIFTDENYYSFCEDGEFWY